MGDSIQDQLLKMGLVSAKQAQQAESDKRQGRKGRKGRKGARGRKQSGAERGQGQRDGRHTDRRAADRQRETAGHAEQQATAESWRVAQIADSGRLSGKTEGHKRFYFESRDGRLPYVQVDADTLGALESGRVAVCESPEGNISLIEAQAAARIAELDRRWLRAWNG